MRKLTRSLPSPAMAVAITALFVALGGTGYAASKLVEHSPAAHAAKKGKSSSDTKADTKLVNKLASGLSVKSAANASHATSADSATHATTAGSAAPSGAAGGSLSGSYPNPGLASNAVTNSNVADHSITIAKVSELSGTLTYDPGTINANTCVYKPINIGLADNTQDVYIVNPSDTNIAYANDLIVTMSNSSNGPTWIRLRVCNVTTSPVTPGSEVFNYAAIKL